MKVGVCLVGISLIEKEVLGCGSSMKCDQTVWDGVLNYMSGDLVVR